MRLLIQRVSQAAVSVEGEVVGSIGLGLLVLVGVGPEDDEEVVDSLAAKVVGLRVFEDKDGKMNLSLRETGGAILAISQFTLYGDVRRGNRPSFAGAAGADLGTRLYDRFCNAIVARGVSCARGIFGARMSVALTNEGPVTLMVDSDELKRPRRA